MNDQNIIIYILIGIIIILVLNALLTKKNKDNMTDYNHKSQKKIKIFINKPSILTKKEDIPNNINIDEIINNINHNNITTANTKITKRIKWHNGKKISEETETITSLTNCPNCGAKIDNLNNKCHYCNTSFNTYKTTK